MQVERPATEVGQQRRGDAGGIREQLPLGHRRLAVPAREEDLVEVGDAKCPAEDRPAALSTELGEPGELVLGKPLPHVVTDCHGGS